jgi:hypothetical protein
MTWRGTNIRVVMDGSPAVVAAGFAEVDGISGAASLARLHPGTVGHLRDSEVRCGPQ